jgi:hypothetical protein
MREDVVVPRLDEWIGQLFDPDHRHATVTMMATVPHPPPVQEDTSRAAVAECDRELAQYRAALAAGADPTVVTKWINETQAKRARLERPTHPPAAGRCMSTDEINELLERLGDVGQAIRTADPEHKAALYRDLGLILIFKPDAQACTYAPTWAKTVGVLTVSEGGLGPAPVGLDPLQGVHVAKLFPHAGALKGFKGCVVLDGGHPGGAAETHDRCARQWRQPPAAVAL